MRFGNKEYSETIFMVFATAVSVETVREDCWIDSNHPAVIFSIHFKRFGNVELINVILVVTVIK